MIDLKSLKSILVKNFFTQNGLIKTAMIHKLNIGNYPEWSEAILFYSCFLEEDVSFSERIYCILNNIKESFVFQKNILGEKIRTKTFKGFKEGYVLKKKPHKSNNIKYTYNYNPKNKSELKKYIKEFAFDKNRVFFTQKVQKEINIVNKILEYTNNLPKNTPLQERAYWIMNDIISFPVCKECGKKVRFGGYKYGYSEFCSDKCCGSNHTKENRKNNKYIRKGQSFEEFYGEERAKEIKKKILEKDYDYLHLRNRKDKTYEEIYGKNKAKQIKEKQIGPREYSPSLETRRLIGKNSSQFLTGKTWEEIQDVEKARKRRLALIKRNNFSIPFFNANACRFFHYLDWKTNTTGQHALTIDGERYLEKLGYWVDYINDDLKIIIEWDEEHHFNNNRLCKKDVERQRNIEKELKNYFFVRIRDKEATSKPFEEIYTNIIRMRKKEIEI